MQHIKFIISKHEVKNAIWFWNILKYLMVQSWIFSAINKIKYPNVCLMLFYAQGSFVNHFKGRLKNSIQKWFKVNSIHLALLSVTLNNTKVCLNKMNLVMGTTPDAVQGRHGWQGPPGSYLDFGFQYALIRNNLSKNLFVEFFSWIRM